MADRPSQTNNKLPTNPEADQQQERGPFKERLLNFYRKSMPYVHINLAWFVLSLPILSFFPALGGLYYAVEALDREEHAEWRTVWGGFKKYGWLSLKWGLVVLTIDIILGLITWFFFSIGQTWGTFAGIATIIILTIWLAINQFSYPLLMKQKDKSIFVAIRNGYVVVLRQPLTAIKLLLLTLLISIVSTLIPPLWILISMALIIHLREMTTQSAVDRIKKVDARRDAIKEHREGLTPNHEENKLKGKEE
jgi:hypothetical protein